MNIKFEYFMLSNNLLWNYADFDPNLLQNVIWAFDLFPVRSSNIWIEKVKR